MPWPESQKMKTKNRILQSAVKLFAEKGFNNVSLVEVMKDAELTHGAFYAHFDSKQALYKQAIAAARDFSPLAQCVHQEGVSLDLDDILNAYLSKSHVEQKMSPCPLAAFATDISHQKGELKQPYTQVFEGLLDVIASKLEGDDLQRRRSAKAIAAMMIGGVVVSRALDDEELINELLEACKSEAGQLAK